MKYKEKIKSVNVFMRQTTQTHKSNLVLLFVGTFLNLLRPDLNESLF